MGRTGLFLHHHIPQAGPALDGGGVGAQGLDQPIGLQRRGSELEDERPHLGQRVLLQLAELDELLLRRLRVGPEQDLQGPEREALEPTMIKHAAQTPDHINPDYVPPTNAAANVVDNAMLSSKFEALKKQWEDGVIDDVTFQIKAEELGYSVDLVEESPI